MLCTRLVGGRNKADQTSRKRAQVREHRSKGGQEGVTSSSLSERQPSASVILGRFPALDCFSVELDGLSDMVGGFSVVIGVAMQVFGLARLGFGV